MELGHHVDNQNSFQHSLPTCLLVPYQPHMLCSRSCLQAHFSDTTATSCFSATPKARSTLKVPSMHPIIIRILPFPGTQQRPHLSLAGLGPDAFPRNPGAHSAGNGLWQGGRVRTQPWTPDDILLLLVGPPPLLTVALPSACHPEG